MSIRLALVAGLLALTLLTSISASDPRTLAQDSSQDILFHAMLYSGTRGWVGLEQNIAPDIATMAERGFFPYAFPETSRLQYFPAAGKATISTGGGVTSQGVEHDGYVVTVKLHNKPPVKWVRAEFLNPNTGQLDHQNQIKENIPGGRWLADGHSREAVEAGLRVKRLRQHLQMLLGSYHATFSRLPRDLAELEVYQGVPRNVAAWQGVSVVDSPAAVDNLPLSLYAGKGADGGFLLKVNTGIGVEESGLRPGSSKGVMVGFGDQSY